jgi:RNA polymerase sigma factor (sigma-70 family)
MELVDDRVGLWSALGRLPVRQRAVLVLRFFEDLTEVQTARALGVSVGTVKSQTSRALARLRADSRLMSAPVGPHDGPLVARAAVAEGM